MLSEQSLLFYIFNFMTFLFLLLERKRMLLNPAIIYLFFNWIMVVGCFSFFDMSLASDIEHALVLTLTPISIYLGYKFVYLKFDLKKHYNNFWNKDVQIVNKPTHKKLLILYIITVF